MDKLDNQNPGVHSGSINIKLRDLKPNPYRDEATYPYSHPKLERLKDSIRTTGFWDNLIVRIDKVKVGDKGIIRNDYHIAYGHHRLKALLELVNDQVLDLDYEIDCRVRHLDDSAMVRIMASEQYDETGDIFAHTIKQVIAFVAKATQTKPSELTVEDFGMFLGSGYGAPAGQRKIRNAIRRIS